MDNISNIYNVALVPVDTIAKDSFTEIAQVNFSDHCDGYLLGHDALPHVTLCQFDCTEDKLETIWSSIVAEFQQNYNIEFDGIYLNPGSHRHHNYIWTGISVRRSSELINLQSRINSSLKRQQITTLTSTGEEYFPHLTLARIRSVDQLKYPDHSLFNAS